MKPCELSLVWMLGPFSMSLCPNPGSLKGTCCGPNSACLQPMMLPTYLLGLPRRPFSLIRASIPAPPAGFRSRSDLFSFLLCPDDSENCDFCSLGLGPFFPSHWVWMSLWWPSYSVRGKNLCLVSPSEVGRWGQTRSRVTSNGSFSGQSLFSRASGSNPRDFHLEMLEKLLTRSSLSGFETQYHIIPLSLVFIFKMPFSS